MKFIYITYNHIVKKSHITCLSSRDAAYISIEPLHLVSIGFNLKSNMESEPIAHLSSCLF